MYNLLDLQQQRAHKALSAKEIVDKAEKSEPPRPMTADECSIVDTLTEQISKLDAQIAETQAHLRRSEAVNKLIQDLETPRGRESKPDQPGDPAPVAAKVLDKVPASCRRTGTLRAFKPKQGETNHEAELRAYRAGVWARAALFNDHKAHARCMELGLGFDIRNAMSTTSNTDGGVLVPDELSSAIIDLREQYGVFRQNCRVWPMGSDTLMIPRRAGGVTVGALGENPASGPSSSTPTFDMVQLVAKKCGGLSIISSEIAEDAVIDLADWIANEWAYAFALFEDQCGFIGDGTSTYLGIRGLGNYLTEANASTYAGAVTVATATHNLFSEIDVSDLAKLMAALPQYAKRNAKFYCSSVCNELVFGRLKATAGGNTVQTLQGGIGDNYLGYPIVISQVLPAGAGTDYDALPMLYFGDLSRAASLGDRRMVRVFPSQHRYMELDQVGILATERIDIVCHDLGNSTTPGPIVALTGSSS